MPTDGEWGEVEPGLFFRRDVNTDSGDDGQKNSSTTLSRKETVTFQLKCSEKDARVKIDAFVDRAYNW